MSQSVCLWHSYENPFPLQEDYTFEKLHFKHSVELSKSVFEMMDGGKKIYPQEGLDEFADNIEAIKSATTFQRKHLIMF